HTRCLSDWSSDVCSSDLNAKTMTVTVNHVNHAPISGNTAVTGNEDLPYTFKVNDFPFSDPADNNIFTAVRITSTPTVGMLTFNRSEEHTSELQSLRHLVC